MAVVVNDGNVGDDTFDVETAANAGESGKTFADEVRGNVEIERDSGGSSGVANIVNPRRMDEIEHAEVVAFVGEAELAAEAFHGNVADDEVGLRGSAISNDGALHTGNDGLNVGLI